MIQTLAVAEHLSFYRAAQALGTSQSNVSARIKALEQDLGILLFERNTRGVRLTEAGRLFVERVAAGVDQLDHAVKTAGMAASGECGRLRVGIHALMPRSFLAELIAQFREDHPGIDVEITEGTAFCPRCGGRRMAQGAANLVERVLPAVPVRQWVLSLPMRQRLLLAWRPELVAPVLAVLVRRVSSFYRGRTGGQTGSVTVIQRFGGALNLNIHLHALFLDGGYVSTGSDGLTFVPSSAPTRGELTGLVEDVARSIERLLRRRGLGAGEDGDEGVAEAGEDDLSRLQLASATGREALGGQPGRRTSRLGGVPPYTRRARPHEASVGWTSLDAGTTVSAADRSGLERLCRYVLRPALSLGRLGIGEDDTVTLRLKGAWTDGTTALRFDPVDFVGRLAALVPPPRQHLVRYHGVLAPSARWRPRVVPAVPREVGPGLSGRWVRWRRWGELMLRVFLVDVQRCPCCGRGMRQVALVQASAGKVLRWMASQGDLVLCGARGPPVRGEEARAGTVSGLGAWRV